MDFVYKKYFFDIHTLDGMDIDNGSISKKLKLVQPNNSL